MKKCWYWWIVFISVPLGLIFCAHADQKGLAEMVLNGGKTGNIQFPHSRHQKNFNEDCQICHELFPQEKNSIDRLKASGEIQKKAVMNNCLSCHKDLKSKGKPSGPVKCKECHSL